ncbi:MAG: Mor transcription activator family protein [FCB group bacterium]|jgi:hypothetical protein
MNNENNSNNGNVLSMDIFELMTEDDMTPDLKMLCGICGMETMKEILRNFGGLNFYIPKVARLDSLVRKYVKKNRDKENKQIARELNVTVQYLYKILKNN